jgi:DNA-binding protein HU-beta
VTKAEFLEQLARDHRIGSHRQAADSLGAVIDAIAEALERGEDVNLTGFGKFHVTERAPRQGVNPRTGERISIAGGRSPRFSAGSGLKAKVRGG